MKKVIVDTSKCPQDHPCPLVPKCPVGAISQDGFNAPEIGYEKIRMIIAKRQRNK